MSGFAREVIRAFIVAVPCYWAFRDNIEIAVVVAFILGVANEATVKGFR